MRVRLCDVRGTTTGLSELRTRSICARATGSRRPIIAPNALGISSANAQGRRAGLNVPASHDAALRIRRVTGDALVSERCEVNCCESAVHDQLGNRPARRGSMHHPMSREAGDDVEVVHPPRPPTDHWIAVELVLLVESRPRAPAAARFESGKPMRERGPHNAFEVAVVDVEVVAAQFERIDEAVEDALEPRMLVESSPPYDRRCAKRRKGSRPCEGKSRR